MLKESMYWLQLQLNLCLYLNTRGELGLHDKLSKNKIHGEMKISF